MSLSTKARLTYIVVPFSFYHKHCYPNAPKGVQFLSMLHPHDFCCEVAIEVFSSDRELEFYLVREFLNSKIGTIKRKIKESSSCEMICEVIYEIVSKKYGTNRDYIIEVSEDKLYRAGKVYDSI